MIRVDGRRISAHRLVWEGAYGQIPNGVVIAHRCDNTMCIELSHLFACSQAENVRDMDLKRRRCHGDKSPKAKVTEQQVAEIRASSDGDTVLGRRYGLDPSYIWRIRAGKRRAYAL